MDSLAQAALHQLVIAARFLVRLVRLLVRSVAQITRAVKARNEHPNVAEMRPPERRG